MKGRKPTPTSLKIIRGNPGKRSLSKNEPTPKAVCPSPPDILSPVAKKHWKIISKQLFDANVMTVLDIPALTIYCEAYSRWIEAGKAVQAEGVIIKQKSHDGSTEYLKQNPNLMIQQKAFDQMKSMLTEFGMTPSSRTRVRTVDKKPSDDDGWDDA